MLGANDSKDKCEIDGEIRFEREGRSDKNEDEKRYKYMV